MCPGPKFLSSGVVCEPCSPGEHSPSGTACLRCPTEREYVGIASGAAECLLCPDRSTSAFSFPDQQNTVEGSWGCVCQRGTYAIDIPFDDDKTKGVRLKNGLLGFPLLCEDCPLGANCSNPGTTAEIMQPVEGWWRAETEAGAGTSSASAPPEDVEVLVSQSFYRCRKPQHCLASSCAPHREGPLCGLCKDGYLESFGQCVVCPSETR